MGVREALTGLSAFVRFSFMMKALDSTSLGVLFVALEKPDVTLHLAAKGQPPGVLAHQR